MPDKRWYADRHLKGKVVPLWDGGFDGWMSARAFALLAFVGGEIKRVDEYDGIERFEGENEAGDFMRVYVYER